MLLLAVALACHKEPPLAEPVASTPEAPSVSRPAPAYTLPEKGASAPCARLDAELWDDVARTEAVAVVVDLAGAPVLPASFSESARTDRSVQGSLPGVELCALAGLEGVARVRSPFVATPKVP